ncbi:unnamed protein product [Thelazia callipaeda]|uniref:D-2-hydroxyglutarate dehydrogenase, mitochondrial n=1 Tax=Thelazia callipaeda TaxID=103827 RepID=A0A0N5CMT6_THECL|nr:unnamed protein product [Thelazia callipaeda]
MQVSLLKSCTVLCQIARRIAAVQRPPRAQYAYLEDSDLRKFDTLLGSKNVQIHDLDPFNCVLFPSNYDQVSQIVSHCYSRNLAVVPQSGNTGLVGGSVPVYDEVIVSLKKLNKRFIFNPDSGVLDCDAGFVLEEVDTRLSACGYMMPWDLGSRGSCLIGGNISTCVGGIRHLRFGSLHDHILGLDVVLADKNGSVVNFGSVLQKDNSSLHTHHIFIGAEGQLGIIVGAKIHAAPRPTVTQVMMLDSESCLKILRLARGHLCEILSAVELMDLECMRCLWEKKQMKSVLTTNPAFTILIETMGTNEAHDKEKAEQFLAKVVDQGICSDGVQAENSQEAAYMWKLRKTIPIATMQDSYVYKCDISLPMEHFFVLSDVIRQRIKDLAQRICIFGHFAESDLHLNVVCDTYSPEVTASLYPFIWNWVKERGGSNSSEHGVGQELRSCLELDKNYEIAKQIKKVFDPRGILSPYKMF